MSDDALPTPLPALDESWTRALCVVAHPDDLEYGTAAAVDKWIRQGKQVTYLLATRGEAGIDGMPPTQAGPLREQEERDGAAAVGVDVVEFLDHRDGVVEYGLPLRRDIARAVRTHRPDVVFSVTHREAFGGGFANQADHRAVGLAALDGARDAGNRWIFPELLDEGHEPWSGVHHVCFAESPVPTHGVDVSGHLEAAITSLAAHREYLAGLAADYPAPEELLDGILSAGGKTLGVRHGLLFEVFSV